MSEKKFTGAGVLIVENYHTADGETIPSILVVKVRSSNKLSDFGGGTHKNLSDTAAAELREESRGLIDIPADVIKSNSFVDIVANQNQDKNEYYRAYFIKADGVASKYFNLNKKVLDSDPETKRYMKETESIHHIPIKSIDFDNLLEKRSVVFIDVHGVKNIVSGRLKRVLFYGREIITDVLKSEPIVTKRDLVIPKGSPKISESQSDSLYVFKK